MFFFLKEYVIQDSNVYIFNVGKLHKIMLESIYELSMKHEQFFE